MKELFITLLIVLVLFGSIWGLAFWADRGSCSNRAEQLDVEFHWKMCGGCFLKVNGKFIPYDMIKKVELIKEKP